MVDFDFLREVSHTTSILDVLDHYKIEYSQVGYNRCRAICPFHNDHDPSLVLYINQEQKDESFYCFVDNLGGDVFRFIELMEQDFKTAWSVLCHIRKIKDVDTKELDELDLLALELDRDNQKEQFTVSDYSFQISTMYREFIITHHSSENIKNIIKLVDQRFFLLDQFLDSEPSIADMRQYFGRELQYLPTIKQKNSI